MKQFFITLAGVFAGLALFFVGLPLALLFILAAAAHPNGPAGPTVLSLDLRKSVTDQDAQNPLAALGGRSVSVASVIQSLKRAETDPRVKGLFIRLPDGGLTPGEADEIRLAVKAFRATGRTVTAHSQGLYPAGAVTSTYMLGAAADQLWMQPGAPFQATGLAIEDIFLKRFFDTYGVKPDFEQRYEYKNAVNGYLYDDYTPAHRESELSWMGSIYESALKAAAADRRLAYPALKATIEAGPYDAAGAKAHGLVDALGEPKEAEQAALKQAGDGAKLVDIADYALQSRSIDGGIGRPTIGVVDAEGDIMTGGSGGLSGQQIDSDEVSEALYAAADDASVKAVVLRLNSPGGSDTASEQILAAVRKVRSVKPIVVSMGAYGASGGYWVASGASAIVAEPTTLTGSIGVFGGKFAVGPALARFGVDLRQTSVGGAYAGSDGAAQPFTPGQKAAFAAAIDQVYDEFVTRVADGRRLPVARVREIARGRVWTGVQAKDLGLVDGLGGFYDAVDRAKGLAGLGGQAVRLKTIAGRRSPFETFAHALGGGDTAISGLLAAARVLSDPRAAALIDRAGALEAQSRPDMRALAPIPRL